MRRSQGYDREWRNPRYDNDLRRPYGAGPGPAHPVYPAYGHGFGGPWPMPFPAFAAAPWALDPATAWMGWAPAPGAFRDGPPRMEPRRSPTYGRGGDEALMRWARRYGYDVEYTVQPDRHPRRRPW